MKSRIERPTKTCAPCRPVRQKKIVAKAPSDVLKPTREYSSSCVIRNVSPIRNVSSSPARRPHTFPRLIDCSAQCTVKLDVTRMHVFTNATNTGSWKGGVGHGTPFTTRTKKYAVKNEPNSITSEAMKRNIPRTPGVIRE